MAYEITDVEIVVIIAIALLVAYVAGSYWKHRTLTRLAHWFEDKYSPTARVQFRKFGHAGLWVKCEMKDRSSGFREVYFTVSLGARENLFYYPLAKITDNLDRLNCWGIVEKPVRSNLLVFRSGDKKRLKEAESRANMSELPSKEIGALGYVAYGSDRQIAAQFLSRSSLANKLKVLGAVEAVELDTLSSLVRTVSTLDDARLGEYCDFTLALGRAV
jgi:hypothetical protein